MTEQRSSKTPTHHASSNATERRRGQQTRQRFVAVSNRLPVVLSRTEDGQWTTTPGSGGLVTALAPVLRNRGGLWLGWTGAMASEEPDNMETLLHDASHETGYRLHGVSLSEEDIEGYYYGFANSVLWPLFHDLVTRCDFDPAFWESYQKVNRIFARAIAEHTRDDDYIWVHDYHLLSVARELRMLDSNRKIGFFLHTPFPPLECFIKLPWRSQVLQSLLDYDLVGFHTLRDRRNFQDCLEALLPEVKTEGKGTVITGNYGGREVRIGAFPISIDFNEFSRRAESEDIADRSRNLRRDMHAERRIMLGVDRLDYTKGIPERLKAFRNALRRYPDLRGRLCLIQAVVPSREDVPEYQALRSEIEQLVGEINGQFTRGGWVPIHYQYRKMNRDELLVHYRAADIALITPLRDGMNLVAKEYCASSTDNRGTLILSEFAGAASQLNRWALMVNPHDVEGVADAIRYAVEMDREEQVHRMSRLRNSIRRNDIFRWVDSFLEAAVSRQLEDFPLVEDYTPPLEQPDHAEVMIEEEPLKPVTQP